MKKIEIKEEIIIVPKIGQCYKRKQQITVGEGNNSMELNKFTIQNITSSKISITGTLPSGITYSKGINSTDFNDFIKKYKLI